MPAPTPPKPKLGKTHAPAPAAPPSTAPSLWRTAGLEASKAVAAAIVGGVVALTTPVHAVLMDLLWLKPPRLEIIAPTDRLHEGDDFALRVMVLPDFPGAVPTGTLRLTVPAELQPLAVAPLAVPASDQALVLPAEGRGSVWRASKAGDYEVTATFESPGRPRAQAEHSIQIRIAPGTSRPFASRSYYGGTWQLAIDANVSEMNLTEPKPGSITGTVERMGSTWNAHGSRDGDTLWLYIADPEVPGTRQFLKGDTVEAGGFLKTSGTVTVQHARNGMWVSAKAPEVPFEAHTPTGH